MRLIVFFLAHECDCTLAQDIIGNAITYYIVLILLFTQGSKNKSVRPSVTFSSKPNCRNIDF